MKRNGYEVYMNRIGLTGLITDLHLTEVEIVPAAPQAETYAIAGRDGNRISRMKWKEAAVKVSFVLEKTDETDRQSKMQDIYAWGKEGALEVSDRPGKEIHVFCSKAPAVPDIFSWADPITIEFQTADRRPFWEAITPSALGLTAGTSGTGDLFVPGNAGKTLVEVTATPASGTLNTFSITVGDTTMAFTSLGATNANPLKITYDDRLIQSIKCGSTSKMSARTGASADDLLAECGKHSAVSFTANVATAVTLKARGLWL